MADEKPSDPSQDLSKLLGIGADAPRADDSKESGGTLVEKKPGDEFPSGDEEFKPKPNAEGIVFCFPGYLIPNQPESQAPEAAPTDKAAAKPTSEPKT